MPDWRSLMCMDFKYFLFQHTFLKTFLNVILSIFNFVHLCILMLLFLVPFYFKEFILKLWKSYTYSSLFQGQNSEEEIIYPPFTGSLLKCLQQPSLLGQAKIKNQKLHPDFPREWQEPRDLPSRCLSRELDWQGNSRDKKQAIFWEADIQLMPQDHRAHAWLKTFKMLMQWAV